MVDAVLFNEIFKKENINKVIKECSKMKTTPGIDNMRPCEIPAFWEEYGTYVMNLIRQKNYYPTDAFEISIPKKNKKERRNISILTMGDRMIQKAVNNVLREYLDPYMHDNNFGFRSGRTTHDALRRVMEFLTNGSNYIVSLDIEKYFDNISHNLLMEILRRHVADSSILVLLKRYIKQNIIRNGCHFRKRKGVIQGAPLSPLFANIYLNEFDWHMDKQNIRFVRFADDILLFAETYNEAERIKEIAADYLNQNLFLSVNQEKSKVSSADMCEFLGYKLKKAKDGKYALEVCGKNKARLYHKLNHIIVRGKMKEEERWRKAGAVHRGWLNYFSMTQKSYMKSFIQKVQRWELQLMENRIRKMEEPEEMENAMMNSKEFVFLQDWYEHMVEEGDWMDDEQIFKVESC